MNLLFLVLSVVLNFAYLDTKEKPLFKFAETQSNIGTRFYLANTHPNCASAKIDVDHEVSQLFARLLKEQSPYRNARIKIYKQITGENHVPEDLRIDPAYGDFVKLPPQNGVVVQSDHDSNGVSWFKKIRYFVNFEFSGTANMVETPLVVDVEMAEIWAPCLKDPMATPSPSWHDAVTLTMFDLKVVSIAEHDNNTGQLTQLFKLDKPTREWPNWPNIRKLAIAAKRLKPTEAAKSSKH